MSDTAELIDKREPSAAPSMRSDNENTAGNSRVQVGEREIPALVRRGAGGLIDYHRTEYLQRKRDPNPVAVEAWGTAERVYEELADQLEYYKGRALAEEMARSLVDHAQSGADGLRNQYKSNVISIQLPVAETVPDALFETGALERERIDGGSVKAEVIGATTVQRHLAYGGGGMSSNCADVDAMFAGTKIWSLWPTYQIPNKSELDGLANETALALLGEVMGGGPGANPELMEELLEKLQKLIEAEVISPELLSIIENLNDLKMANGLSPEQIQSIATGILGTLSSELSEGLIPSEFANEVLSHLSEMPGVEITPELQEAIQAVEAAVPVQAVSEKLQILAELEGIDPADSEALLDMIEELKGLEGQELADALDTIHETLDTMDLPDIAEVQAFVSDLRSDIEGAKQAVEALIPDPDPKMEMAIEAAPEILALLQTLDGLDAEALPAELTELLARLEDAGIDVADLSAEKLADAFAGQDDPAVAEIVQDIVMTLNNPDVQAALPQEVLNEVNVVLRDHADLVEAITVENVVNSLQEVLDNGNISPEHAEVIRETIARLEAGEGLDAVTPEVIEAIKADASIQEMTALLESANLSPEQAAMVEQAITALQDGQPVSDIAPEVMEIVETQHAIETLNTMLASGDLSAAEAAMVQEALAKLEAGESLQTIDAEVMDMVRDNAEPPVTAKIDAIAQTIDHAQADNVVLANETVEKIGALNTDLGAVQDALKSIDRPTPEQAELIQKLETVIETLKADPANIEAMAELQALDTSAIADLLPPDVANNLQQAVERVTESAAEITSIQETALAIKHDVSTADIQNTAEVIVALNNNAQEFKAAGIDINTIKDALNTNITSAQSLSELAKAQDTLANASPETAAAVRALVDTQITAVAESTGIERPMVEQAVAVVSSLSAEIAGNDALKQALSDAGVDIDKVVSELDQTGSLSEAAKIVAAANSSPEVQAALPAEVVESAKAVVQANAEVIAERIVADSPSLDAAEVKAAVIQANEIAAIAAVDPAVRDSLQAAGIEPAEIERIVTNMTSPEGLSDIAKLASVETLPPAVAEKVEAIMNVSAESVAAQIVSDNPGMDVQSVKDTLLDTAKLAAVAEQLPELRQTLEQSGIEPKQIDAIIQDLKDPGSMEALKAVEAIKQAGPEAVAVLENRGIDIAQISDGQLNVQAARLDIEPKTLEAVMNVSAALSDTGVQAAVAQAGMDAQEIRTLIETNPGGAQTIQAVMDLKEAVPADAKAEIQSLETRVIAEAAAKLGMEGSELKEIITSSPEAKAEVVSKLSVIENTPDTAVTLSASEGQVLSTRLSEIVTNNSLPPAQAQQMQAMITKIETGQPVSAKEVVAIKAASELSSPQVKQAVHSAVSNVTIPARAADNGSGQTLSTRAGADNSQVVISALPVATTISRLDRLTNTIKSNQSSGTPLTPKDKVQAESLNFVARQLEGLGEQKISPKEAEIILLKLDTAASNANDNPQMKKDIAEIRQDIVNNRVDGGPQALPEQVKDGPCPGCPGGDCKKCTERFDKPIEQKKADATIEKLAAMRGTMPTSQAGQGDSSSGPATTIAANDDRSSSTPSNVIQFAAKLDALSNSITSSHSDGSVLSAKEKVQTESMTFVARQLEGLGEQKISPKEAEIILLKLDTAASNANDNPQMQKDIADIRQDIVDNRIDGGPQALPEQVKDGPCPGCPGGDCEKCKERFDKPIEKDKADATLDKLAKLRAGLSSDNGEGDTSAPANDDTVSERPAIPRPTRAMNGPAMP